MFISVGGILQRNRKGLRNLCSATLKNQQMPSSSAILIHTRLKRCNIILSFKLKDLTRLELQELCAGDRDTQFITKKICCPFLYLIKEKNKYPQALQPYTILFLESFVRPLRF